MENENITFFVALRPDKKTIRIQAGGEFYVTIRDFDGKDDWVSFVYEHTAQPLRYEAHIYKARSTGWKVDIYRFTKTVPVELVIL